MVHISIRSLIAFAVVFADGVSGLPGAKRKHGKAAEPAAKRSCLPPPLLLPPPADPATEQANKEKARCRRGRGGGITPRAPRPGPRPTVAVDVSVPVRRTRRVGKNPLRARIPLRVDPFSTPRDMLDLYFSSQKFKSLVYKDRSSSPSCDRKISIYATWLELYDFYKVPLEVDKETNSKRFVLYAR
jgi:hypothetical protein